MAKTEFNLGRSVVAVSCATEKAVRPGAVLGASVVGSIIEWYDYALYGTAAALIFSRLFFPSVNSLNATVATFGTFAAGFLARPLGGLVAGYYGDKLGRKATLVLTLLTMSISTTLIGALPTYADAGVWAPILLIVLRLCQGFAVGGEWGGAVLMAVEFAPEGRRGLWGAFPQLGVSAGIVLGTGAFYLTTFFAGTEAFMVWGWRVPFLVSIVLAGVGMYIRLKVSETPAFQRAHANMHRQKSPLIEVIRTHPKELLLAIGARFADGGNYYIYTVFVLAYAADRAHVSKADALLALMIAASVNILACPFWGGLSDRFGRRPVFIFGALFMAAFAWPFFQMIDTGSPVMLALALSVMLGVGHPACYGTLASYYAELFPSRVRYSGISIGYQSASIILGGFMPLIASALVVWSNGKPWPVVAVIAAQSLVAALSLYLSPETYKRNILDEGT
jgi:metabolite-proton symporter